MNKTYSRDFFVKCGKEGGKKGGATTKKKGKKYFQALQRKSVEARKRNKKLSTGTTSQ